MIEIVCQWRNDAARSLEARAEHLLAKTAGPHGLRWLWVVGDCSDDTERILRRIARASRKDVRVLRRDTGVVGEDTYTRRLRTSASGTSMFQEIHPSADFVCLHESDLRSPQNVIERLLAVSAREPVCGWPVIDLPTGRQFYDIWAYRDLAGNHFSPHPPHAKGWQRHDPFQLGSMGSLFLAPAELVRGRVMFTDGLVDVCRQWQAEGVRVWCDSRVVIEQPTELWEAS
jgi:hypothetical protein